MIEALTLSGVQPPSPNTLIIDTSVAINLISHEELPLRQVALEIGLQIGRKWRLPWENGLEVAKYFDLVDPFFGLAHTCVGTRQDKLGEE